MLWLLWLLPLIGMLIIGAYRRRQRAARRFASPIMLARLMPQPSAVRTWVKSVLLTLSLGLLVLAVARPQFGTYFEQTTQHGVDVAILLDVSRSMLAEDIAPNRLERAKSDIVDLLDRLQTDRVALIVFAGAPVMKVPLTTDHGYFRMILRDVSTDSAPYGGSLLGDAIRKGMEALPEVTGRDQAMVLITDGEDQQSFAKEAAIQAGERGIKIFTVGLGDPQQGARIPIRDQQGRLKYVQHDGQEVWSQMQDDLLRELALATGGAYVPARTRAYDLGRIYQDHLSTLAAGNLETKKRQRFRERYQWFAAMGFIGIVLGSFVPTHRSIDEDSP